eukprot:5691821-Lingulodinium_polyedra.AAC.1
MPPSMAAGPPSATPLLLLVLVASAPRPHRSSRRLAPASSFACPRAASAPPGWGPPRGPPLLLPATWKNSLCPELPPGRSGGIPSGAVAPTPETVPGPTGRQRWRARRCCRANVLGRSRLRRSRPTQSGQRAPGCAASGCD